MTMTAHADIAGFTRTDVAGIGVLRRPARGRGRPLLFLHGVGSNAQSFAAMMASS